MKITDGSKEVMRMKCPRCGVLLVKTLPDCKIITLDKNVAIATPIVYFEYDMNGNKTLRKAFMCPVCGYVLVDERFERGDSDGA